MNAGDKYIIELEAQMNILDEALSDMEHSSVITTHDCMDVIRQLHADAECDLARELDEKDQAAKDDRDDMKMEEERGGC